PRSSARCWPRSTRELDDRRRAASTCSRSQTWTCSPASSIGERDVSLIGVCDGASEDSAVGGGAGVVGARARYEAGGGGGVGGDLVAYVGSADRGRVCGRVT